VAGGRKLRVSCGPVATFNPSKQEAKGGSDEAQDSIVLSMSNEFLYLVPELHTQQIGEYRQNQTDRSNTRENKKRVDYDYKVGDKILIRKDCVPFGRGAQSTTQGSIYNS
jgi:hypothetical protein